MLPKTHIILGFFASMIIYFIFPEITLLGFFIIWASSVLIDVDHYLFYVWLKKDWSVKNAFYWFYNKSLKIKKLPKSQRKKINPIVCFLHGIEAVIVLSLLAYFVSKWFLYVLIGFLFHEFLDGVKLVYEGYSLRHITCQTWNLISFKKRSKRILAQI